MTTKIRIVRYNLLDCLVNNRYALIRIWFKLSIICIAILVRLVSYLIEIRCKQALLVNKRHFHLVAHAKDAEPIRVELARSVPSPVKSAHSHHESIHKSLVSLATHIQANDIEEDIYANRDKLIKSLPLIEDCLISAKCDEPDEKTYSKTSLTSISDLNDTDCDVDLDDSIVQEQLLNLPRQITKIHECLVKCEQEKSIVNRFIHDDTCYAYVNFSETYYNDDQDNKIVDIKHEEPNKKMDATVGSANTSAVSANTTNHNGLPDLINQKGNNDPNDKARKYLEGLDGVKFNEIQVPDQLKKQLEYFDRDELLQLIAYQKKYLDFKESRIKDLENYIDNLVVKIIEKEPSILMNASNVLSKSRNLI